jgi:phosphatidylserine/phosphatidylglycerophosphate/cardiolipin synthase-like enzyme
MTDKVRVVVTGISWMGSGIGSIESAIDSLFSNAKQDVLISAYSIGNGTDLVFDWIKSVLNRGILVRMIVNQLEGQPAVVVNQLVQLTRTYPHFDLYEFIPNEESDLHAKVIVVDHKQALVGSSNLSRNGIIANHEMALLVEGPVASQVASALDKLCGSQFVRRV